MSHYIDLVCIICHCTKSRLNRTLYMLVDFNLLLVVKSLLFTNKSDGISLFYSAVHIKIDKVNITLCHINIMAINIKFMLQYIIPNLKVLNTLNAQK
jgi:hypothetical protein